MNTLALKASKFSPAQHQVSSIKGLGKDYECTLFTVPNKECNIQSICYWSKGNAIKGYKNFVYKLLIILENGGYNNKCWQNDEM